MALTMTRTRTQTTLTRLAAMVTNIHGELEFLDRVLAAREGISLPTVEGGRKGKAKKGLSRTPEEWATLDARKVKLCADRDALYATIRQFDPVIDPGSIGSSMRLSTRR